jgi:hypothetical protein
LPPARRAQERQRGRHREPDELRGGEGGPAADGTDAAGPGEEGRAAHAEAAGRVRTTAGRRSC